MRFAGPGYAIAFSAGLVLAGAMVAAVPASACGMGSRMVRPDGRIVYLRCGYHANRPHPGSGDARVARPGTATEGHAARQARVQRHDGGRRVRAHRP